MGIRPLLAFTILGLAAGGSLAVTLAAVTAAVKAARKRRAGRPKGAKKQGEAA
jgi:hypothetical protein